MKSWNPQKLFCVLCHLYKSGRNCLSQISVNDLLSLLRFILSIELKALEIFAFSNPVMLIMPLQNNEYIAILCLFSPGHAVALCVCSCLWIQVPSLELDGYTMGNWTKTSKPRHFWAKKSHSVTKVIRRALLSRDLGKRSLVTRRWQVQATEDR